MFVGITPQDAIAIGCTLVALASALYVARGWPIAMRRALQVLSARLDEAEAHLDASRAKLAGGLTELASLIEDVEGLLNTIERKRKRVAGYEAREKEQSNGQGQSDDPYLALRRRARQAGHPV